MNRKQVIETLEMENELICFNPLTGEEIPLEYVNDLNKNCYEAHQEAIRLINNSIPIEWIKEKLEKEEYRAFLIDYIEWSNCLRWLLEEWGKENE